jgi:hypothetical protein
MQQYIKLIGQLCLLKSSPEQVPYSRSLLIGLIVIHLGVRWLGLSALPNTEEYDLFGITILWMACSLGLVYAVLFFKGLKERWFKVMTSLLGVEVFFLVFLQVSILFFSVISVPSLSALLVNGAVIWILVVKARIFQIALDTRFLIGVVCALVIEMLSNMPVSYVLMDVLETLKP